MRENERNDIQSKVCSKYCLHLIVVNYTKLLCYQNEAECLLSQDIYENNNQQNSLMLLLDILQST